MRKLKIFESNNKSYDSLYNEIINSNRIGYDNLKKFLKENNITYDSSFDEYKIPLITDKETIADLGYDTSYTDRVINCKVLLSHLKEEDKCLRVIRSYHNNHKEYYIYKKDKIDELIKESSKLDDSQKSKLQSLLIEKYNKLIERSDKIKDKTVTLLL